MRTYKHVCANSTKNDDTKLKRNGSTQDTHTEKHQREIVHFVVPPSGRKRLCKAAASSPCELSIFVPL